LPACFDARRCQQPARAAGALLLLTTRAPALADEWYYQCLPAGQGFGTLDVWDQCGGKGGNCAQYACVDGLYPGQSCPSGSTCQRLHEWYSQCRPGGSSYGTCEQVSLWSQCGGKSSKAGTNSTDQVGMPR
jgi:hypothetical protein